MAPSNECFDVRFTFKSAHNLPLADISSLSADPYIVATLRTDHKPDTKKDDPPLQFRTQTVHRNVEPQWNSEWEVSGIPASGFLLKIDLMDEDVGDKDDRMGTIRIPFGGPQGEREGRVLQEGWRQEKEYRVSRKGASQRAYLIRGCAAGLSKKKKLHGWITLVVEVLGKSAEAGERRLFTMGPNYYSQHYSPMLGKIAGTKNETPQNHGKEAKPEKYSFQANKLQLTGPVPFEVRNRYVEFAPWVASMYKTKGPRGWLLNKALHHQHRKIYAHDKSTIYGVVPPPQHNLPSSVTGYWASPEEEKMKSTDEAHKPDPETSNIHPEDPAKNLRKDSTRDVVLKFLDMVHYDEGGRIFTYVLTLDAQWRFTETGKQFGIDLLSKHTMHSDVTMEIACAGEFFVRRLQDPNRPDNKQKTHPPNENVEGGEPNQDSPKDPELYELVIDNDSGTYRPDKSQLPLLKKFLEANLKDLRIKTMACDDDELEKLKDQQRKAGKKEGDPNTYVSLSRTSSGPGQQGEADASSSDEEGAMKGKAKATKKVMSKGMNYLISDQGKPKEQVKGERKEKIRKVMSMKSEKEEEEEVREEEEEKEVENKDEKESQKKTNGDIK